MLVMVAFSACNHITMLSPFIFSIFVGEIVFVMLVPHSAILLLCILVSDTDGGDAVLVVVRQENSDIPTLISVVISNVSLR